MHMQFYTQLIHKNISFEYSQVRTCQEVEIKYFRVTTCTERKFECRDGVDCIS